MTLYGLIKLELLVSRQNPTITDLEEQQEFGEEMTYVNLRDDANMRFAFSVMDMKESQTLLDPRYVKVIARVLTRFAGEPPTERVIDHHPCTDDDWAKFSPPDETAVVLLRKIQKSKELTFLCLDWERDGNELSIGLDKKGSKQRLEFMITPCNYVH